MQKRDKLLVRTLFIDENRLFLCVSLEGDFFSKVRHRIDMIHPVFIDRRQSQSSLEVRKSFLCTRIFESLNCLKKKCQCAIDTFFDRIDTLVELSCYDSLISEVIYRIYYRIDRVINLLVSDGMSNRTIDFAPNHLDDIRMYISSIDYFSSTRIDRKTMVIQDIIILEDVFSNVKIPTLYLFLDGRDIPHEHLALDQWITLWM